MKCPPTVPIEQALAAGFAATVATCFIMDLEPKLPEAPKGLLDDILSAGRWRAEPLDTGGGLPRMR